MQRTKSAFALSGSQDFVSSSTRYQFLFGSEVETDGHDVPDVYRRCLPSFTGLMGHLGVLQRGVKASTTTVFLLSSTHEDLLKHSCLGLEFQGHLPLREPDIIL